MMPASNASIEGLTTHVGANEVLTGLKTEESKAAYLIQIIAIELHKASKAIDPAVRLHSNPSTRAFLKRAVEHLPRSERSSISHHAV